MKKLTLALGMLWAAPVTLLPFLLYIMPLWLAGIYMFKGWDEVAWVWEVDADHPGPSWLSRFICGRWKGWSGSTMGNVMVVRARRGPGDDWYDRTLVHEKEHSRQVMRLGIVFPVAYMVIVAVGKALSNADGYSDNIFEIDARRKAGMLIDVVGAARKLQG